MSKSEAQVIAKLKELCDDAIDFDTKASIAAAEAATTDSIDDARRSALETREFAGAAYGCYLEAMSLFDDLPEKPNALPTSIGSMVEEMVQSAKGMEDADEDDEPASVVLIRDIERYSNNAIKSAKKADESCIRIKRVIWHPMEVS